MFSYKIDDEVSLHLLEKHHAEEVFELVDQNRAYLREWLPWVDNMTSPEEYHTILPMWLRQFADGNGFNAGIRYKGKLVGMIGLHAIDRANRKTSIGYYIAEEAQGKGIVTKSVKAILDYVFRELGLNRVEIRCGVHNKKSRAIPERLGFVQEGIIRDGEWLYDHFHDLVVYSMLAKDWLANSEK
jgi:ribosomal-protein-serine acetyltransferase